MGDSDGGDSQKVVYVGRWYENPKLNDLDVKLKSLDLFIRSKIMPPAIGSAVFNFDGGRAIVTHALIRIEGECAEVIMRGGTHVTIRGNYDAAYDMFCCVHRELEDIGAGNRAKQATQ